jgi:hypothetical protein
VLRQSIGGETYSGFELEDVNRTKRVTENLRDSGGGLNLCGRNPQKRCLTGTVWADYDPTLI